MNTLYYGDNLTILREYIKDESIDLIYLDPPFNSNRAYNVLFKDESGQSSEAQITAFDDTWHWGPAASELYYELVTGDNLQVGRMTAALHDFIGENQMMAYLVMMATRLIELHRVLKPAGSIYLHCDPTASHYLKIILDTIFSPKNFRAEITWKRSGAHNLSQCWDANHDIIFFYSKTKEITWNQPYEPYSEQYLARFKRKDPDGRRWQDVALTGGGAQESSDAPSQQPWRGHKPPPGRNWSAPRLLTDKLNIDRNLNVIEKLEIMDKAGYIYWPANNGLPRFKQYLDLLPGSPVTDIWIDIPPINSQAQERLGYPTQKPLALLERIIQASSNPGDIVLDPFSGCGTAIAAAQKLNRQWIGIDITHLAIAMHKSRLKDMFGLEPGKDYRIIGEPEDLPAARQLAQDDRYQFQWWALSLVKARPIGSQKGTRIGKKGSDRGIDGLLPFVDNRSGKPSEVVIQVKSGHVNSAIVRDLRGVLEREGAPIGVLITLENPTSEMQKESLAAGFYTSELWQQKFPRLQILSVEDLLNGKSIQMPPPYNVFRRAERVKKEEGSQGEFEFNKEKS